MKVVSYLALYYFMTTGNKDMKIQNSSSEPQQQRPCKISRRDHAEDNAGTNQKVLTFVEFYCGVGGWRMALEAAVARIYEVETTTTTTASPTAVPTVRLQCIAALDHSDLCTKVYQHNNDDNDGAAQPSTTSIEKLTVQKAEEWKASIWAMSPPCQPHTRQHDNQNEDLQDPRSKSFLHLCDLMESMKTPPELVLLENVIGFERSGSFQRFRQVLSRRNYALGNFHLSPTQVGLPNDRPRHFAVAVRLQTNNNLSENDIPSYSGPLTKYVCQESFEKDPKANDNNGSVNTDSSANGMSINAPACKIHTSLKELGVQPEHQKEDSDTDGGQQHHQRLPCIAEILDRNGNDNLQLRVPEKLLSSNAAWCFDIVTPQDQRSSCFTHSYGQYVRGTGSVLYFGDTKTSSTNDGSERLRLVPPEEREFDKDWAKGLDLTNGLRYFSGMELARLFDFSDSFSFPTGVTRKQQWKLLGNSLNVRVAARISELGLRLILKK